MFVLYIFIGIVVAYLVVSLAIYLADKMLLDFYLDHLLMLEPLAAPWQWLEGKINATESGPSVSDYSHLGQFANQGTTAREMEVRSLLNRKIPGGVVQSVRFAGNGGSIFVSIDLYGGRTIRGGYVGADMTAQQQADSILSTIQAMLRF